MCTFYHFYLLCHPLNLYYISSDLRLASCLFREERRAKVKKETFFLSPFKVKLNPGGRGGGGYSWKLLVRVCRPVLQILILFQTKRCHFPHPFLDKNKNKRDFLKSISNFCFHISLSLEIDWN